MRGVFLALQKNSVFSLVDGLFDMFHRPGCSHHWASPVYVAQILTRTSPRQEEPCAPPAQAGWMRESPRLFRGGGSVHVREGGPQLASNPATIRALREPCFASRTALGRVITESVSAGQFSSFFQSRAAPQRRNLKSKLGGAASR